MNDHQGEQQDAPSSSSEPLNNLKEGPESEAVPTPEEQGASSIAAGNPEEEPPAGVVDDTSTLDGGGSLARSESETESQSPPLEAQPIAPESAPVSNATATTAKDHPRAGLSEEESNERDKVSVTAHHPEPTLKVKIHLVAVGSAPILKRTKFQIGACNLRYFNWRVRGPERAYDELATRTARRLFVNASILTAITPFLFSLSLSLITLSNGGWLLKRTFLRFHLHG